jgi:hypothetical protein
MHWPIICQKKLVTNCSFIFPVFEIAPSKVEFSNNQTDTDSVEDSTANEEQTEHTTTFT